MKKKIILVISIIVVLFISIIGFLLFRKEKANKYLDKLINSNSYSVKITTGTQYSDPYDIDKDRTILLDINKNKNYEYVEENDDCYYRYNDKLIQKVNSNNLEEKKNIWFYNYENDEIYSPYENENYGDELNQILEDLTKKDYKYKDKKYILTNDTENIMVKIQNLTQIENDTWTEPDGNKTIVEYKLDKISISIKKDNIDEITFSIGPDCNNMDEFYCDKSYFVSFKFTKINEIDGNLPKDVEQSLEETTAKDWVGEYTSSLKCPGGKEMVSSINLTNQFNASDGKGWKVKLKIDPYCSDGSYTFSTYDYYFEEDTLIVFSSFDNETIYKFKYSKDTLDRLDKNNKVIETFTKSETK